LPDIHGPCVCGDPCWIGPQGNGCDYALYTPESKKALLDDRELLVSQLQILEQSNPRHPRLGQWKARIERLDQLIKEIENAEARATAGEPVDRPRDQLVPYDPPFEATAQPSTQRSIRQRRREAAQKASTSFKRVHDVEPLQEIDAQILAQARSILQEQEMNKVPMTIKKLARQLGIRVKSLYTCREICDSLSEHNKRCPFTSQEIIEISLKKLSEEERTISTREFEKLCGIPVNSLSKGYAEWSERLIQQNRAIHKKQQYKAAEQHLQEVIASQQCVSVHAFAKSIGMSAVSLREPHSDIAARLVQHNRALGLTGAHCPREERVTIIYNCFNAAILQGEQLNLCQLAERCHLRPRTICRLCPEIIAQLHEPPKET
jgi:AraC-like DNA-binding protein